MIAAASVFRLRPDVRYRLVPPDAVVVRQSVPEVVVLNGVGARVVTLLDGRADVAAIVHALLAEYEVTRDQLERDVDGFLSELIEAALVEEVAGGDRG